MCGTPGPQELDSGDDRGEILLRRLPPRCPRSENHAGLVVAIRLRCAPPIFEREAGQRDGVDTGAIEPSQLHGRDPRGGLEARRLGGDPRPAAFGVEPDDRRDGAAPLEKGTHKGGMCGAECRDDAETGHTDGGLHGRVRYHEPMRPHRAARWLARLPWALSSAFILFAAVVLVTAQQKPADTDSFDELYRR